MLALWEFNCWVYQRLTHNFHQKKLLRICTPEISISPMFIGYVAMFVDLAQWLLAVLYFLMLMIHVPVASAVVCIPGWCSESCSFCHDMGLTEMHVKH